MKATIELNYTETSKVVNALYKLYMHIVSVNHDVIIDDTSLIIEATNKECDIISELIAKMEEFRRQFEEESNDPTS